MTKKKPEQITSEEKIKNKIKEMDDNTISLQKKFTGNRQMLYFIENFIPYMDKRVNDMLEIKNEVSSRSTGGNSQISISLPKEMHDKFRCYTKDRGISMEGLFKKWMSEYIIYCESEYKRVFAAKLEHRDGERAAHLRECRRINAKKQHEAKLAMKEAINPDDVEDDLPFDESPPYQGEEYGCEGDF